MVFLQQALGFLVMVVAIQSALSRFCPLLCKNIYYPICVLNPNGKVKEVFANPCSLEYAICLNSKSYDDVEWQPCTLGHILTGSSVNFQFGGSGLNGSNFFVNGDDNQGGSNNNVTNGEGHQSMSTKFPVTNGEGHQSMSTKFPVTIGEGHQSMSTKFPVTNGEGHQSMSTKLPVTNGEGHQSMSTEFPPIYYI